MPSSEPSIAGGNVQANVDGIGTLTYQRAMDTRRNTEGDLDENVLVYIESALTEIWARIQEKPTTYILTAERMINCPT